MTNPSSSFGDQLQKRSACQNVWNKSGQTMWPNIFIRLCEITNLIKVNDI